jgi:hypothetical protein
MIRLKRLCLQPLFIFYLTLIAFGSENWGLAQTQLEPPKSGSQLESTPDSASPSRRRKKISENRLGPIRSNYVSGGLRYQNEKMDEVAKESKTLFASILYVRDFGFFGLGPLIEISNSDNGISKLDSTKFGILARVNFVENRIGNDSIPFLLLAASSQKTNSSGVSSTDTFTKLGLGWDLYPFSNYFAIAPSLELEQEKTESGLLTTTTSLNVSLVLSFN